MSGRAKPYKAVMAPSSCRTCDARRLAPFRSMLVLIDESGDPGFKLSKGSASVFVAVLVAFRDMEAARQTQTSIDELAHRLRLSGELKFSKSRPEVKDSFFTAVRPFNFRVRAIVVKKELIYSRRLRSDKESFYSFFVKSMLKFDGGLLRGAKVVIDGSGDREFRQELGAYLRRHCGGGVIKDVRFADSANDRLIQLADMCAGAIPRARKDPNDQTSQSKAFIEAARELGCDEDPAHFDEILKKVARHKPAKAPRLLGAEYRV